MQILGIGAGILGIAAGVLIYYVQRPDPRAALIKMPVLGAYVLPGSKCPGLYSLVKNKYYLDELYWNTIIRPLFFVTRQARWFDQRIVDAFVNGVGHVTVVTAMV